MHLYNCLSTDERFIDEFCDVLEVTISRKVGYSVNVHFTRTHNCIYFFFDGSSVLQVMPDTEYQYTYANSPIFQNEIRDSINIMVKKFERDEKIDTILKND